MTALRKACEDWLYGVDGDMRYNSPRGVLRTLRYESHPDIADAIIDESELTDADIAAILIELAAMQASLEEKETT